jgi:hypothetical protein
VTITSAQRIEDDFHAGKSKNRFVYADTDSLHVYSPDDEIPDGLDIDPYRLGAWKLESTFKRGKYIRQKCYIELGFDDKMNVTVAGLPKKMGELITFENFNIGFTTEGLETDKQKLTYKHVKGGVMLAPVDFSIK